MATDLLLRHPGDPRRFPPIRLHLTGATLVTTIDRSMPKIQNLPSRETAREHLDRILRLRRDEGYHVLERGETADDEVEPVDDPIARLVKPRDAGRRAQLDFEEDPVTADEVEEVVARVVAAAPTCIDFLRTANVPGGLLAAPLAGKELPSVRALIYCHHRLYYGDSAPDDLATFFAACPNLERVVADGEFALGEARHPVLSELHLRGSSLFPETLAALGAGALPALTLLDLLLGEAPELDRAAAVALRSVAAPRLDTIHVAGIVDVTRFLAVLTTDPLPPSWAKLHCRGGVGDEDDLLAVLQQRAATLASLAELGLPLAEALSEGGVAQAKGLLPRLVDVGELPDPWTPSASAAW